MSLNFRKRRSTNPTQPAAVPNYSSRRVQYRLLAAVGSFFLLLMVIERSRDPVFREFIGLKPRGIAGGPPLTEKEIANRPVNTALRPVDQDPTSESLAKISVSDVQKTSEPRTESAEAGDSLSPLDEAWRDGWTTQYHNLKPVDQDLLLRGLKTVRDGKTLPADRHDAWKKLLEDLERGWSEYRGEALQAITKLPAEDQDTWRNLISQLAAGWSETWSPALRKLLSDSPFDEKERTMIEQLQGWFDQMALDQIEDDTIMRPNEREAWFRMFERLAKTPVDELRKLSTGPIGFLQLFEQPKEYRGKLVTIRGTAKLAYHVVAPKNVNDLPGYYVFWIHPAGGPDSPITVYSLETPEGFPQIKDKDKDRETTTLYEEVEFTGYFFKRIAYSSKGGIHTAPLLLARSPRWSKPASPVSRVPSVWQVLSIIVGTAGGGIAVAYWVYRQSFYVGPKRGSEKL